MAYANEEKKVLRDVESIMSSGKTHSGKLKDILKSLLSFFVKQEKYKVVKSLVELLQPSSDESKAEKEKIVVRRHARSEYVQSKLKGYPKKHSKGKIPLVTVSHWLAKSQTVHGYFYCNAAFNRKYRILERGLRRVRLGYEERDNAYIIDMLFARDGKDGMGRKDYVYDLRDVKTGSFKFNCTDFLNNHRLVEKYQKLGIDDKGKPRNRFSVKRLATDQFFFTIPKVY